MICRGCCNDKKLVKSHVIPESFFRDLREDEDYLKLISPSGEHPKRSPIAFTIKRFYAGNAKINFSALTFMQQLL